MNATDISVGSGLKVTCSKDELVAKLGVVARAVSTRTAVQVFSGVKISAEAGELRLAATDMELSLRSSLAAQVDSEGETVVPGRRLVELARLLPESEIRFEHKPEEGVMLIDSGAASYRLNTYNADDFPRLPDVDAAQLFAVDRDALLDTIARVQRSASRDESRPVLTGILASFQGTKLVMVATDSYRLSVKETALEAAGPDLEAIIPARALAELTRIGEPGDALELGVHDNQVIFRSGDVVLTSRRIDGQFPNHAQLIPETFETEVPISRTELLDVVRRVAVIVERNSPLRLQFAEGTLTVSAKTQDVGEASESLPVAYTGEPLEIGFNAEFLRDGLESVSEDEVTLKLISSLRPGLIQAAGDDFRYLIMPIRLAG